MLLSSPGGEIRSQFDDKSISAWIVLRDCGTRGLRNREPVCPRKLAFVIRILLSSYRINGTALLVVASGTEARDPLHVEDKSRHCNGLWLALEALPPE